MKKKILFIIPSTGEGGIEKLVIDWINILRSRGYNCEILALQHGNNQAFDQLEILIKYLKIDRNILSTLYKINKFFRLHTSYDAIHTHVSFLNGPIGLFARLHGNTNIVSHAHLNNRNSFNSLLSSLLLPPIYSIFKHLISLNCNYKLACSDSSGKFLYGSAKFLTLKNAIKTSEFSFDIEFRNRIRKEFKITGPIIMHVGRFSSEKNHEFLIDIFYKLYKINNSYQLFLFGEGELKVKIIEKANLLGIQESIHFMGYRNDVHKYFSVADLFIFPSFIEGFPVVLVEAQAAGLRILASENIPEEVRLTDLISFLPLTDVQIWVDKAEICSDQDYQREKYILEVRKNGYDVDDEINLLIQVYNHSL